MFKEKSHHVLLFCCIVALTSAVLQYLYPTFSLFDGGLIVAILLTVFLKHDHYTKLFGAVSAALVVLAACYRQHGFDQRQLIFQHFYSLIFVVLATVFVLYVKHRYRSMESDQQPVKALFDHAAEGIILTDDKGKIVLLNPAAFSLFRYEPDELPAQSIDTLIPARFRHSHIVDIIARKHNERELLNRQQKLEKITEDVRRLNTDLEAKVEQRTRILREALQELEKSREELNEALSKEKELGEIKSRFVSMASHEFRTPLSTILSSAHLLSKYTTAEDQDKRDKHIKRTKDAVKQLNVLLEDFLSVGKLEEDKIRPEPTRFALRSLLEETTEEMQSLAKKDQPIYCQCTDDLWLTSDKRLVKNIVVNLLSNAIKFSAEGAPIRLQAQHGAKGGITISVLDKGVGISAADQQHLFSSFFRGANVTNIEGTGLGLHIVRRYLDLLQGTVALESSLGEGTLVTVDLPEGSA